MIKNFPYNITFNARLCILLKYVCVTEDLLLSTKNIILL